MKTVSAVILAVVLLSCSAAYAEKLPKEVYVSALSTSGDWGSQTFVDLGIGQFVSKDTQLMAIFTYQAIEGMSATDIELSVDQFFGKAPTRPYVFAGLIRLSGEGVSLDGTKFGIGVLNMLTDTWGVRMALSTRSIEDWSQSGLSVGISTFLP